MMAEPPVPPVTPASDGDAPPVPVPPSLRVPPVPVDPPLPVAPPRLVAPPVLAPASLVAPPEAAPPLPVAPPPPEPPADLPPVLVKLPAAPPVVASVLPPSPPPPVPPPVLETLPAPPPLARMPPVPRDPPRPVLPPAPPRPPASLDPTPLAVQPSKTKSIGMVTKAQATIRDISVAVELAVAYGSRLASLCRGTESIRLAVEPAVGFRHPCASAGPDDLESSKAARATSDFMHRLTHVSVAASLSLARRDPQAPAPPRMDRGGCLAQP
jgi:hypothetical protein